MDINTESVDLNLNAVVDAVRNASDKELKVLAEIAAKISLGHVVGNSTDINSVPVKKRKTKESPSTNQRAIKPNSHSKDRSNEVTVGFKSQRKQREWHDSESSGTNSSPTALVPATSKSQAEKHLASNQVSIRNSQLSATSSAQINQEDPIKAISSAMSEFKDFWHDEKGRLRRGNGQYATKEESKQYKSAADVADERDSEKSKSVLGKLVSALGTISSKLDGSSVDSSTDAAGVAAGSSYFYAAKEMYDLGSNAVEHASNGASFVKEKVTSKKEESKKEPKEAKSKTKDAIENSHKANLLESLKEQTEEQKSGTEAIIKKLDDLDISNASDGGGLMDSMSSIGDLFDGPDRDGKRKSRKSKRSKMSKWGRAKSVLSNGSESVTKNKSFGSAFKVGGGLIAKFAAPIAALTAGTEKFMELKDREDLSTTQKAAQVTSTGAGAAGGAAAGAMLGAVIGSAVPVVGTAMGALVGAILGGIGGTKIGESVGKGISDFIGSDQSLTQYVSGTVSELWNSASNSASSVMDSMSNTFSSTVSSVQESATEVWSGFTSSIGSLFDFGGDKEELQPNTGKNKKDDSGWFGGWFGDKSNKPQKAKQQPVSDSLTSSSNEANNVQVITQPSKRMEMVKASILDKGQITGVNQAKSSHATEISKLLKNEQVSGLKSQVEFRKETQRTNQTQTVTLDKKSLDALSVNNPPPVITESKTTNPNVTVKSSPSKSSGDNIPNDFLDLSLQRQAADLE